MTQLPVVRLPLDAEIHVALGGIGVSFLDQALDELDDLGQFLRGPRVHRCPLDVQGVHLSKEVLDVLLGQLLRRQL